MIPPADSTSHTPVSVSPRVLTVSPMPAEASAYALARYSRSPDSIADSIAWVRNHDSSKFLDSFYFQYGHASIADLGHVIVCLENISELAATEIEDEQLWDGQARSSRYQDFSRKPCIVPPDLSGDDAALYSNTTQAMIAGYQAVLAKVFTHLTATLPRPDSMKPDAYERNLKARAFDVARYLLPFGIPTGVGQVTSIRTLERQIRRMKASAYQEIRDLGNEIATSCTQPPAVQWDPNHPAPPIAPTLAKYVEEDRFARESEAALTAWVAANLALPTEADRPEVEVLKPSDTEADIVATLLYPVTGLSYATLYALATNWPTSKRREVMDVALATRGRHDELPRAFRTATYAFDMVMDIGAYRDLHRHRRCQQFRQSYHLPALGFSVPEQVASAGATSEFSAALQLAEQNIQKLPSAASHYLLPFAAKGRFLFKMDFAEAEYIAKLRSGVKGHFSYRRVAWLMKETLAQLEPALADRLSATDPQIEDPLVR
jgi:thymidylate synthase ThyX